VRITLAVPVATIVPDLTGMTLGAAAVTAQAAGLAPYPVVDSVQDLNRVISQVPAVGVRVIEGTAIVPTITSSPLITMPNIVGMTMLDAAVTLRAAAAPILQKLGLPPEPLGLALGAQSSAENRPLQDRS